MDQLIGTSLLTVFVQYLPFESDVARLAVGLLLGQLVTRY